MLFTNAYSAAPNCAPTRAALMSGQYSPRTGVYTVSPSARGKVENRKLVPVTNQPILDADIVTIAETLRDAGYKTGHFGKWHLGEDSEGTGPVDQGFDINIGGTKAGSPRSYFSPYRNAKITDGEPGENLTDRLTNEAIKFMHESGDQQFFVYLSFYAVHTPLQPKADLLEKYNTKPKSKHHKNAKYAAMVETLDTNVGRLLSALTKMEKADDTIVIFTSDNGGHGGVTSQTPLRGSKGMLYEGGIRVPLIVRWPGVVETESTCDQPVITVDFYPTLMSIAECELPNQVLDGKNLLPLLQGEPSLNRDALFWHFPVYLQSYKGLNIGLWRATPCSVIRAGDFKLIEYFEDGKLQLFNLRDDPSERNDISSELPEKTSELHQMLIDWRQSIAAPVPTQLNPKYNGN